MEEEEQRQKEVITTIGELKKAVGEIKKENIIEKLQQILDAKEVTVNIIYDDIDDGMSFIVKPLTVAIQLELEMFNTPLERYKHMITKLVTTTDGRPLSYKEVDMMPLGMQQSLISAVEEISFSQHSESKKLEN